MNAFFLSLFSYAGIWRGVVILSMALLASAPLLAQVPEAAKPSDVRIVIDISGSMKKNDPQNLRRPALDMLVKLLPENSKGGVWTFGQFVNMLVKHQQIDSTWKQLADQSASSINSIAQFTNIGEALEKAAYDSNYSSRDQFQTHVILLTDGMVDISRDPAVNDRERQRILNEILPTYQKAGYRIHTVSLSDKADKALMEKLALGTDGKSVVAKTADELMNVFLQVFDQAVPKEELPFSGNSFLTDSSIEEFTALIFRQPGSPETRIISPDNTEYSQNTTDPTVNWYRTDKYDLVTIKRPLEGEWKVVAELEPQSRITVVSDLSLAVKSLPTNILEKHVLDLSFALREENKVVNRAEFLDLLDIDVTVNHQDKTVFTKRLSDELMPGNGVFTQPINAFDQVGQYTLSINVDGKSFQRQFTHSVNVRQPFKILHSLIKQDDSEYFKIQVIPQDRNIDTRQTEVVGKLKSPDGSSNIERFSYTADQEWSTLIKAQTEGQYYLTLRVTRVDEAGKTSDLVPPTLELKYPQAEGSFEALFTPEPEVTEPEVEAEPSEEVVYEPDSSSNLTPPEPEENELMDEETDYTQWILYGALAFVNILIILVIYILYRKLFGSKVVLDEDEMGDDSNPEKTAGKATEKLAASASAFEEPPMDEMVIDELDEDDIDLAEEEPAEANVDLDLGKVDDAAQADDDFDEDPEFSLDDFAPDELDDDSDKDAKG